jgi:hypothetical protein
MTEQSSTTKRVGQFPSLVLAFLLCAFPAFAASAPVHGLWVWKTSAVLDAPHGAAKLRDFCRAQDINEVYVSFSAKDGTSEDKHLTDLIARLHRANIRVEALLSSTDADEAGKPREKLLDHVRAIVQFNQRNPENRFDGIHLDIEPQQRPENKGAGNLKFLPGLVDAWRRVRALAEPAQLTVNADIQNKLLKGSLAERKMLLSALPRLTLMLYEVSSPGDGDSAEKKIEKLRNKSTELLETAYAGLSDTNLAKMSIGLRTPDYGELLPKMLQSLGAAHRADPHYLGWARHSYNDTLK